MTLSAVDYTSITGQAIIERAFRLLGSVEAGESLTADELADGLEALNHLLESLSIDPGMAYRVVEITHTLMASDASYTIGTAEGTDIDAERPVKIESGFIRWENSDTQLKVVNGHRYDATLDKTLEGLPKLVFYDAAVPTGTLTFYYVPDAAYVAHLRVLVPLAQFGAVSDTASLPPGMARMLCYNLAVDLAPELRKPVPPTVARNAELSAKAFRKSTAGTNTQQVKTDAYLLASGAHRRGNILTGETS